MSLKSIIKKHGGRDSAGRLAVRHQGGEAKRFLREIDFKRNKIDIPGKVASLEYDPNRSAKIALIFYADGDKRYILAPDGLKVGDEVLAGPAAKVKTGNALKLSQIPIGTAIHNLELRPGKGGEIVRSAGAAAFIISREGGRATVKLPSGEVRMISENCWATIGQVGQLEHKLEVIGTAGRARRKGKKPEVRGTAQNPHSHPHGGGEGRTGVGMPSPVTPWGKPDRGRITRRKRKYSDSLIIKQRE